MGFLRNAYNMMFEPAPSFDETYVPDEEDLAILDFSEWVPPTADELGDDRLMTPKGVTPHGV